MTFKEFEEALERWHVATAMYSTRLHIARNPNCKRILEHPDRELMLGYTCLMLESDHLHQVIILLCEMVEDKPPIDNFYAGCMAVHRECWKCWALSKKILTTHRGNGAYWVEDSGGNRSRWI